MNVVLWIAQGILAALFLLAGTMKMTRPRPALQEMGIHWTEDFSDGVVKLLGATEALGALGLILPALTGILPILTPLAAIGLTLQMLGAVVTHIRRKEPSMAVMVAILGLIAAFIAYGRFVLAPLA